MRTLTLILLLASLASAQPAQHPMGDLHFPFDPTTRPAGPATRVSTAAPKLTDKLSITEHEITLAGQPLRYRATAGYMPVKDESGKEKANFFFVAYDKLPTTRPSERPITFVFNGGPGAAAVWLEIGALGPKRLALKNDIGDAPVPPYKLVDNEYTWLDLTDLVFIDPVGTGYSRSAPGENPQQFYGVKEDVASVGDFIRLYTTRYERWLSPKFLAGESYGTTRAAALSESLLDRFGLSVNGIVLISSVLNFQAISPGNGNDLPYALYLPSYSAIAWYHHKLAPDLQADLQKTLREAQQFALDEYTSALAKGSKLAPAQRKMIIDKLARYTSLSPRYIDKADLRISPDAFRKLLLEDDRRLVGRFDGRIVGYDLRPAIPFAEYDPSLSGYLAAYSSAFNDYVRRELGYENDLTYEVLSSRVGPWSFSRDGRAGSGYLNVSDDLSSAMAKLPFMKVFVAAGYFDLATPYLSANYAVDHLDVSAPLRANITQKYYMGGHMMYHNHEALVKLKDDIRTFVKDATGASD